MEYPKRLQEASERVAAQSRHNPVLFGKRRVLTLCCMPYVNVTRVTKELGPRRTATRYDRRDVGDLENLSQICV